MTKPQAPTDLQRDKRVTTAVHRLFWQAIFQRKDMFALTYLCNLPAFFAFNVYIPLQVAYGIQAILTRNYGQVGHHALVVLLSSIAGTAIFAIGTWADHRVNLDGAAYVQRVVFANYLNKDYDFYANRYAGALGGDAIALRAAFQNYEFRTTLQIPRLVTIIVAGLAVIFYKSWPLGLVSIACVSLVIGEVILVSKFRLGYRRVVSQASSRLAGKLGDPLAQAQAVKGFAQEQMESQRLEQPLRDWRQSQLKLYDTSIPHTMIRHILLAVTMAGLLLVSGHLYLEGAISIAIVALVQLYVVRIVNTSVEIGEIIKQHEKDMSEAYEPVATMLVEPTVNDSPATRKIYAQNAGKVTFDAVTYAYPEAGNGRKAINGFSLVIKPGEKVGLIGHSGGGKTTVTKLLLRFMDVGDGSIQLGDTDIREVRQADLRKFIAYVPQEPLLFHRSIRENIAYARPEASLADIKKAAATAFVDEFVQDLPNGYDTMVGERGVKLSGGQRQRVAIARALLKDAPILVLDEATSALDSQSERYIQKALWKLMADRTAIVVAHRLSTIQRMDRIVVMEKGKIVQVGTHRQLLKDTQGTYAKLWAHQSDGYLVDA